VATQEAPAAGWEYPMERTGVTCPKKTFRANLNWTKAYFGELKAYLRRSRTIPVAILLVEMCILSYIKMTKSVDLSIILSNLQMIPKFVIFYVSRTQKSFPLQLHVCQICTLSDYKYKMF
jgi:hypothetical protein